MVTIKTKHELEILREGGKRLAKVLKAAADGVRPGSSAQLAIRAGAVTAACLGAIEAVSASGKEEW